MGYLQSLAALFVVTFGFLTVVCQSGDLQLLVKTLNRCQGSQYSGLPVGFEKLTYSMKPESGNIMMNGFIIARKELDGIYIIFEIGRCLSEDSNSCQHFVTLNYTDICHEIHKENAMWSTFVENTKGLPGTCPVPPGRYEMDQAYLDLKKIQETFKFPAGIWMAELKFMQRNELLTCYYIMGTIKPVRKRKINF